MARQPVIVYDAWPCLDNGQYRLSLLACQSGPLTVTAVWESETIASTGTAVFTIDGQPMENGAWNLASERAWVCSGRPAFLDVDVTGFPAGGRMNFFFR